MKLYDGGRAPNPRRVRIFLAEKAITVPIELIDIGLLAMQMNATSQAFIDACFNFPSLAELYKYATYDAMKRKQQGRVQGSTVQNEPGRQRELHGSPVDPHDTPVAAPAVRLSGSTRSGPG